MTSRKGKHKQLVVLFDKQNGICGYCDGETWLSGRETYDAARARLGIPKGMQGAGKLFTASMATREHLTKRADGGANLNNLMMACHGCNVRRGDSTPEEHRTDMQALVAAGLHPTNRPKGDYDPHRHHKAGLKALKKLRQGQPISTGVPT